MFLHKNLAKAFGVSCRIDRTSDQLAASGLSEANALILQETPNARRYMFKKLFIPSIPIKPWWLARSRDANTKRLLFPVEEEVANSNVLNVSEGSGLQHAI